jgi:hypothetical protein
MIVRLSSAAPALIAQLSETLDATLEAAGLAGVFESAPVAAAPDTLKGADPVTLTAIVLTAVGAGGALTVAMGKEGFLTRLAKVLEAWVNRKVEVTLETDQGKLHLSGSAAHIERMLKQRWP